MPITHVFRFIKYTGLSLKRRGSKSGKIYSHISCHLQSTRHDCIRQHKKYCHLSLCKTEQNLIGEMQKDTNMENSNLTFFHNLHFSIFVKKNWKSISFINYDLILKIQFHHCRLGNMQFQKIQMFSNNMYLKYLC